MSSTSGACACVGLFLRPSYFQPPSTQPGSHIYTKNTLNRSIASVLETASYCHETDYEQRHNVLLVGDSLGDLHMSDGYAYIYIFVYIWADRTALAS